MKRLLVVDDEHCIRRMLRQVLREHEVVEASSGRAAQRLLAEDRAFDLVITDVMMPDLDGVALHRWLAKEDPALARKVVFISGGVFKQELCDYLEGQGLPLFTKPLERSFARAVREWMGDDEAG